MESFNEEYIDNVITNLKIISLVKVDEKLSIRKGHLQIDTSSNFQFIKRWFFRDSRDFILLFIKDLIRNITNLLNKIDTYHDRAWITTRILSEMENAKGGLMNLKTTYSTDPIMVVKFENVNAKFCELVNIVKLKAESIKHELPPSIPIEIKKNKN
jgi:hypothetical protein